MSGDVTFETVELDRLIDPDRPICYGVLKPGPFVEGGVPLVRILDIEGDELSTDGLFRISAALDKEFARSRLEGGELLLSIQGTVGKVAVVPKDFGPANISRTIARLAFTDTSNAPFLRHWFRSQQGQRSIDGAIVGTTRSSLNIGVLRRLSVPHFTGTAKGCINEVLDTLDFAIHETEAIIAKLKAVKQGLLHDLLTRGIGNNGELRPTQADAPGLYKDSPLGWIPRDWSCDPLSDLLKVKLGFAFSSHDYVDDGILSFRVTNVGQPSNDLGGIVKLPIDFLEKFPKQRLDGGEIMIVMVGATTGKMGRVPYAICPALQNQNMWNLVPKEKLDLEFAWIALPSLVERHLKQAQGSARDFLTQSAFLVEFLGVPPLEEQAQITSSLGFIEKRIEAEKDLLNKMLLQKNGLIDDLLTGRVRVTSLMAAKRQGAK
jgi:type I restriction enzyme S subunit